jgi:hypothetical protein
MDIEKTLQLGAIIDENEVHTESIRILERLRDLAIEAHDDVTAEVINKNLLDLKRLIRDSK